MRRRNNPFSTYSDSEQKLRHRTNTESILASYLELYMHRLLPEHRYTEEFMDLVYSHLSEEQLRSITRDLLVIFSGESGIPGETLESAERYCNKLEIENEPKDLVSTFLVFADKKGLRKESVRVLEKYSGMENKPIDSIDSIDRFHSIASAFSLNNDELNTILFLFLAGTNDLLESVVGAWSSHEKPRGIGICIGVSNSRMDEILEPKSRLRADNLVEISTRGSLSISLVDELFEYLAAPGANSLYERYLKPAGNSDYLLDSFPVRASERALCRTLLGGRAPVQLLLHGSEGTGKTEFAKALVRESGKTPYVLDRSDGDRTNNLVRLTLAQAALPVENSVIIVDEADAMLDGGRLWFADLMLGDKEEKAKINTFMDNARCPVIWIANSIEGVQPSTRRRFTFSVEFRQLKPNILAKRVVTALAQIGISDRVKKHSAELASSRKLTGAVVANLCTTLSELAKTRIDEDTMIDYVSALFSANSTLVSGKAPRGYRINPAYKVDVLNVSMEPSRIISAVSHALEKLVDLARDSHEDTSGLRILFHGLPGTGKTEFARYIAMESGRKLDIRRSSDILSPYVGVAEKNIASMFSDAEESGDILLIDEADAFLYNRGKARHSWEITQVDEFLSCMEEYRGILICTTNLLGSLDPAVIRRFQIKTEFLPLESHGTERLLANFFPSLTFDSQILRVLAVHGPYVPGDFSVVKGLCTTLAQNEITAAFVIDALIGESRHRGKSEKTIGF